MISVIVPVYKVEPYLQQCVDSILNQTYRDLEVLLIDDGSPDKCGEICDEYEKKDKRVRVFHTESRGLSAARNLGLREAKGDYIGFVDSDDWIEPDMYEMMMSHLEETRADICVCGLWYEFHSYSREKTYPCALYCTSNGIEALFDEKINNNVWNKLYRKAVFQDVLFPEGMNFEDIAIMHRVLHLSEKTLVVSTPAYHYRVRTDSIRNTYSSKNLFDCVDACMCRYNYGRDYLNELFYENEGKLLQIAAFGICKIWLWWYGFDKKEKYHYKDRLRELKQFSEHYFPLQGYKSWPIFLRIVSVFTHSENDAMFCALYVLNNIFRKIKSVSTRLTIESINKRKRKIASV